jgi:NADH dehydrogenase FAD-containing subunit
MRRLGVKVEEDSPVVEIEAGKLRLARDQVNAFDVCIVAAAFDAPDLAAISGLPVDKVGRLRVDEHLRCVEDPSIIGAGDAIVAPDQVAAHLRMGCAVALPLGGHAAETLLASIREAPLPVLSIGFVLQCISLGRKKGYIQVVRPDDSPRPLHIGGRAGALIKEKICEMVVASPKKEGSKPGAYSWPRGPQRTGRA